MKISELESNSKVANLVVKVDRLEEPKETQTGVKVQEGLVSDDSGQVKISLWDDEVDMFAEGDKISMATGWCKEFQGELQISTGKFGKMHKIPKEGA